MKKPTQPVVCFENLQRVIVLAKKHPLHGKTGTVVRMRLCDDGAFVEMDKDIPDNLASFAKGDRRRNHVLLYPCDCGAWVPV